MSDILAVPVRPTKILCVGRNYADHAAEMGNDVPAEPLIFMKPPTSLIGSGGAIVLPTLSERVDYEGELALVIGRRCRHVTEADALGVVAAYTIMNDVTARDLQKKDGQWTRAKGFDTFAPCGPHLVRDLDPTDLEIKTLVNGQVKQHGRTSQFIFSIPRVIAWLSAVMTLEEGDVISTGTPAGVGPLTVGDEVAVTIEGIGTLTNKVVQRG